MEWLLHENNGLKYFVADAFESKMLMPVIKNLLYKVENEWDDYDEVYHCCRLIEAVRKNPAMKMDFHFIKKGQNIIGVGLITYGIIDMPLFFPEKFHFADPMENVLIFNYFHISSEGRGVGEHWLRYIILSYYREKRFVSLYVKSSHPKVFTLYSRLGECVGEYSSMSDNRLQSRAGKIFRIPLQNDVLNNSVKWIESN